MTCGGRLADAAVAVVEGAILTIAGVGCAGVAPPHLGVSGGSLSACGCACTRTHTHEPGTAPSNLHQCQDTSRLIAFKDRGANQVRFLTSF